MKSLLLVLSVLLMNQIFAQITTVFQSDLTSPNSYTVYNNGGGDWVITNAGPTGQNAQFMGAINSSTPTEFALYDSEALGGIQQHATIRMNDYIDVSGFTFAYVCFLSYYKHDAGTCNLQVSNDGGATWVNFPVHASLPQGDSTLNPSDQLIDVSPVAGLQPAVSIRFVYDGPPGYAWMVDDICVLANNSPIIGLDEHSTESFKVYPNPTNGVVTVDLHKFQGELEVQVRNLQGQILHSEEVSSSLLSVDLELDEPAGSYFVTVVHDGGRVTVPLLKR